MKATKKQLPPGVTPRLLSEDAAAAYLGVTAGTFTTHVRPNLPPVEIGARRLWDVRQLDGYIDNIIAPVAD